ncbi:hypothetical protein [Halogeometricum sp. CBA1124]|uniref:hypothetical protein n=1 Tax=Halogeometricum sp. CBA1124 TaxID=2668071 RepID=UPI001E652723|nr:hypothetical protein [Halogeometricum sp. CBA1124]
MGGVPVRPQSAAEPLVVGDVRGDALRVGVERPPDDADGDALAGDAVRVRLDAPTRWRASCWSTTSMRSRMRWRWRASRLVSTSPASGASDASAASIVGTSSPVVGSMVPPVRNTLTGTAVETSNSTVTTSTVVCPRGISLHARPVRANGQEDAEDE